MRQRTRIDLTGYKEATLWRRIGRRLATNHVVNLDEYLSLIAEKPDELDKDVYKRQSSPITTTIPAIWTR